MSPTQASAAPSPSSSSGSAPARIPDSFRYAVLGLAALVFVAFIIATRYNEWLKRPARYDPKPLPTGWRRRDIASARVRWATQPDNSLFFSLPRELRELVYEQALGGRRIRLFVDPRRLQDNSGTEIRRCVLSFANPRGEVDHAIRLDRDDDILLPSTKRDPVSISLLRVCRQVYQEAHLVVWKQNTFCVDAANMRTTLLASLGAFALPHIQALCLYYSDLPPAPAVFAPSRKDRASRKRYSLVMLQKMTSLRVLECHFNGGFLGHNRYNKRLWASPTWSGYMAKIPTEALWGTSISVTILGIMNESS
ncbi:hypothetical protein HMN09_01130800 [Mycena chlorophos]|uniref:DUF7730 domain-containing protein n=1 Tax=Mycena chlorophos TaxID=658473 RepID=A0A8H6SAI3_MYCCL|nr:hypothetical protein HMN09_01130800 [Mycena chlorophos]